MNLTQLAFNYLGLEFKVILLPSNTIALSEEILGFISTRKELGESMDHYNPMIETAIEQLNLEFSYSHPAVGGIYSLKKRRFNYNVKTSSGRTILSSLNYEEFEGYATKEKATKAAKASMRDNRLRLSDNYIQII